MTVIAVRVDRESKKIVIGSDSQTTYGWNKYANAKDKTYPGASKIFEASGMVMGCAGLVKGNAFMTVFAKNHKPKSATVDDVLAFFVEFQEWAKKQDDAYKLDENQFILVFEGKVFEIVDGFLVQEVGEYNAIGSGMFLALGALYHGHTVEDAIEAAKEFDLYCGGPTIIKEIAIN